MTNTTLLKSFMVREGFTMETLAEKMELSRTSMSYKINNRVEFRSSEIKKMQNILNLTDEERDSIFFAV